MVARVRRCERGPWIVDCRLMMEDWKIEGGVSRVDTFSPLGCLVRSTPHPRLAGLIKFAALLPGAGAAGEDGGGTLHARQLSGYEHGLLVVDISGCFPLLGFNDCGFGMCGLRLPKIGGRIAAADGSGPVVVL